MRRLGTFMLLISPMLCASAAAQATRPAIKETPLGALAEGARYASSPDLNHIAVLNKVAEKFVVSLDGKAGKEYDWIIGTSLTFTADSQHLAYIVQQNNKMFLVVDDKEQKPYHEIINAELLLSRAGERIAYFAKASADGPRLLVVDGQESKEYDQIGGLSFSPDGKHYVCAAEKDGKQFFLIDGVPAAEADRVIAPFFVWSPDSARHAYVIVRDAEKAEKKAAVVVDGKEQAVADDAGRPVFSPDSKHVAYAVRRRGKMAVVLDGKELAEYGGIAGDTLRFSPDSNRLAYGAVRDVPTTQPAGQPTTQPLSQKVFYVIDGKELREYDSLGPLVFSPDSKRVGYIAVKDKSAVVVVDNYEGKYYEQVQQLQFSPDSAKAAYLAGRDGWAYCVVDHAEGPQFANIGNSLLFSKEGGHMAYAAVRGRKGLIMLDGVEGKEYPAVAWDSLAFSPDGKHIAYAASEGENQPIIVIDRQEIPTGSLLGRLVWDGPTSLHTLIVRDKQVNRLQLDLGSP